MPQRTPPPTVGGGCGLRKRRGLISSLSPSLDAHSLVELGAESSNMSSRAARAPPLPLSLPEYTLPSCFLAFWSLRPAGSRPVLPLALPATPSPPMDSEPEDSETWYVEGQSWFVQFDVCAPHLLTLISSCMHSTTPIPSHQFHILSSTHRDASSRASKVASTACFCCLQWLT